MPKKSNRMIAEQIVRRVKLGTSTTVHYREDGQGPPKDALVKTTDHYRLYGLHRPGKPDQISGLTIHLLKYLDENARAKLAQHVYEFKKDQLRWDPPQPVKQRAIKSGKESRQGFQPAYA